MDKKHRDGVEQDYAKLLVIEEIKGRPYLGWGGLPAFTKLLLEKHKATLAGGFPQAFLINVDRVLFITLRVNSGEMKQAGFGAVTEMAGAAGAEAVGVIFDDPVREVEMRDALVAFWRIREGNRTCMCVLPYSRQGENIVWGEAEESTGGELSLLPPWFPVPVN
jgi:hypothetical protein